MWRALRKRKINLKEVESQKKELENTKSELKKSIEKLKEKNNTLEESNNKLNKENSSIQEKNKVLEKQANTKLTLQQMTPLELQTEISKKQSELSHLNDTISERDNTFKELDKKITTLRSQIIDTSDQLSYEENGLYTPKYNFANSSTFKGRLSEVRDEQKSMIKDGSAVKIIKTLTLNYSESEGKKAQKKNIKQLLRSFNSDCEAAISKVTKSNYDRIAKRISSSFDNLNKLNDANGIRISTEYLDSKLDEARIALEYALKKEEEKEILREQKQRENEERQFRKQLEAEKRKYEKDATHFEQVKELVEDKIQKSTSDVEVESLKKELANLQDKLNAINEKKAKLTNRADNPTAGYVYIISNIGSFGERVFKIGVTRRLDPMDRINELGSASVPFKFDVHALIFSEDAYKLETELHNYFDSKRINKVNKRKEFFKLDIDEIKNILNKHKELTFDFHETPEAPEYRESLLLEKQSATTKIKN
ncbi:DUF4041 domain-containing protein [Lactobacillus sp. PV012]|nr:DUF4041 domain-containing protein [Lactobacillus sp. PV012]